MLFSQLGLLAAFASTAAAQAQLLFYDQLLYGEYVLATQDLGLTADYVDLATWNSMTTADFAKYQAIVISDPDCGDLTNIDFFNVSKAVWSPAITGNVILIGTDPTRHLGTGGAEQLMKNSIQFAAAHTDPMGNHMTGLYFSLSCYYNDVESAYVDSLSAIGDFNVRGNLSCYNDIHLVARSAAINSLADSDLSNWDCSVHEVFTSYPSNGVNGFNALAIANGVLGPGAQQFADNTTGLPYIISRGASPMACGDGIWDPTFGEECDDGNLIDGDGCSSTCRCESNVPNGDGTCKASACGDGVLSPGEQCDDGNNVNGDGCSSTCQCEVGLPVGDGTCSPPVTATTTLVMTSTVVSTSVSVSISISTVFPAGMNMSTTTQGSVVGPVQSTSTPVSSSNSGLPGGVYIRPACPTTSLTVGAVIIVQVSIYGDHTSICSTMQRPIYDYDRPGSPCYACEMKSEGINPVGFYTVSTTACPSCYGGVMPTPALPVFFASPGCTAQTLSSHAPWTDKPIDGGYVIPYKTPSAHVHHQAAPTNGYATSPADVVEQPHAADVTPAPVVTPYPTPADFNAAQAVPGVAGTGTGILYKPTATPSAMSYEGGGNALGVTFGALSGAVLALAALL